MQILKSLDHWLESNARLNWYSVDTYHGSWPGGVALGKGLDPNLSTDRAVRISVTVCKA